jgi:hypothetical protein
MDLFRFFLKKQATEKNRVSKSLYSNIPNIQALRPVKGVDLLSIPVLGTSIESSFLKDWRD